MNTIEEFKDHIRIDTTRLDEELIAQADLFYHVSDLSVKAASRRDALYDGLKTLFAELDLRVRQEMVDNGEKSTEGVVKSRVLAHPDYERKVQEHLNARLEADQWGALRDAFSQRSYMLRDLVNLTVSGYLADTSVKSSEPLASEVEYQKRRASMAHARRQRLSDSN